MCVYVQKRRNDTAAEAVLRAVHTKTGFVFCYDTTPLSPTIPLRTIAYLNTSQVDISRSGGYDTIASYLLTLSPVSQSEQARARTLHIPERFADYSNQAH
jgi:hypothetical protein